MSFEFETKEQREAFGVTVDLFKKACGSQYSYRSDVWDEMRIAAARFDEREKTCGIEPLSKEHSILAVASLEDVLLTVEDDPTCNALSKAGLLVWRFMPQYWDATRKGREVLANLNAMCKVQA